MSIYTVITPRINVKFFNTTYSKNSSENMVTQILHVHKIYSWSLQLFPIKKQQQSQPTQCCVRSTVRFVKASVLCQDVSCLYDCLFAVRTASPFYRVLGQSSFVA
jgi:hypothetical protein